MSYEGRELHEIHDDVEQIKKEVHSLTMSKQDKIRAAVIVPFVLYLISQTLIGVWWASKMTTTLENIEKQLIQSSISSAKSEKTLTQLLGLKLENIRDDVQENKDSIQELNRRIGRQ